MRTFDQFISKHNELSRFRISNSSNRPLVCIAEQRDKLCIMIRTIAVQGYWSLPDLTLLLGQLSLITGANGSGESSLYRSLRSLADAALNSVVASLAREGGLPSTYWTGPEAIARNGHQKQGSPSVDNSLSATFMPLHR
jgi:predicted ATPase